MAFLQPLSLPPRHLSVSTPAQPAPSSVDAAQYQQPIEESQEWVLFSPSHAPSTTARTHTTSTERTPRTAGLSRVSEFGSLDTAARSGDADEDDQSDAIEDDGELDSLDDGLHAFREPSVYRTQSGRLDNSGGTVLPAHDGLGTFRASSLTVQEQIWQFEQYNPKRKYEGHHRRRSSVQRRLDTVEETDAHKVEEDRRLRIERWRMEQSRALLDEIEKETRRRRNSRVSFASTTQTNTDRMEISWDTEKLERTPASYPGAQAHSEEVEESESWLTRITRRVIRDLMGIDESLLSVIFGESLVSDDTTPSTSPPTVSFPDQLATNGKPTLPWEPTWQDRLLERIARELGILVHQLSEHPGAFTTYLNSTSTPEYAGIPVSNSPILQSSALDPSTTYEASTNPASTYSPHFTPTLQQDPTHAALWGIEEEHSALPRAPSTASMADETTLLESERQKREREYWERELGVKMVFRFLRNRFMRRNSSHYNHPPPTSSASNTHHHDHTARRAAMIRQHHPLVARANQDRQIRRTGPGMLHPIRRQSSSCASQSTKVSAKRTHAGSGSSSRNYWDLGGSVGSGSAVAPSGGLGAWGEV